MSATNGLPDRIKSGLDTIAQEAAERREKVSSLAKLAASALRGEIPDTQIYPAYDPPELAGAPDGVPAVAWPRSEAGSPAIVVDGTLGEWVADTAAKADRTAPPIDATAFDAGFVTCLAAIRAGHIDPNTFTQR